MHRHTFVAPLFLIFSVISASSGSAQETDAKLRDRAIAEMRRAATYFHDRVAVHGGYVYYYSLDLQRRLGEGVASPDQVWVQPPGTPTVGMAYLSAYRATGDKFYLDAATDAARALIYGQLESGGWTNSIDFDPRSKQTAQYRNGKGRGRNYSTLDDGITQGALRCLMQVDRALDFKNQEIHQAAQIGLDALLKAQFPNGAFPQVWSGPVSSQPSVKAAYPDYDWRTENRVKEYWNFYTLNDDLTGYVADTLIEATAIYHDKRFHAALAKLGDFLTLAQMPAPQPAWAQQYDFEMRPVWARKFEPPAVTGRESQDAIDTLMKVYVQTGDMKYLEPIPRALAYLKSSLLPDGRLSRYYELQTNKPLYMTKDYTLTHNDGDVPSHYGWKIASRIDDLQRRFERLQQSPQTKATLGAARSDASQVMKILADLDEQGRWISTYDGEMIVGQPKFKSGEKYIASAVFSCNLEALSDFIKPRQP